MRYIKGVIAGVLMVTAAVSFPAFGAGADAAQAAAAAAKAGLEISQATLDAIWKATGMADKPYVYAFYVDTGKAATSDGDCHNDLQDGDQICFYAQPKQETAKTNYFHITLKQPNNTWWKALTAHKPPNTFSHEIVYAQDDTHEHTALISYEDMLNYFIVLSKAKAFAAHTNMYWIQNSYDLGPDEDWVIVWKKD